MSGVETVIGVLGEIIGSLRERLVEEVARREMAEQRLAEVLATSTHPMARVYDSAEVG